MGPLVFDVMISKIELFGDFRHKVREGAMVMGQACGLWYRGGEHFFEVSFRGGEHFFQLSLRGGVCIILPYGQPSDNPESIWEDYA